MLLYLMRHGEAASPQIDPECGLTDKGKSKIEKLAAHVQLQGTKFKNIYHSKKKRALQTAEIMRNVISPDATITLHNYIAPNDDPAIVFSEINHWTDDTLITSHLPFVPNLLSMLTGQDAYLTAITFETGTLVCLEKNANHQWQIKWATAPSEIDL